MQQGRVQLDADWNEQADIIEHRIATEITDFIGQSGGPQGEAGFEIGVTAEKLTIGYGRYYVEGMLYENDELVTFDKQPDYPGVQLPSKDGYYLAYLDVWQRHLTALEDPDIREPALGGADTATRSRNVWQVRLQHLGDQPSDRKTYLPPDWQPDWEQAIGSGTLTAEMSGAWTGLENQLYRVEIHDAGGPGQATYKWSRDNGSIAARVAAISRTTITLSGTGRVLHDAFEPNQWVELTNEECTLQGRPGLMVQLGSVQGDQLTVVKWPEGIEPDQLMIAPWPDNAANPQHVIVRRWDSQGAIPIPGDGAKQTLEAGIQIWFSSGKKDYFKTGDYWVFPARNLTGKVEWPGDETGAPLAQPPRGTRHQYCSLALLEYRREGWRLVEDLRALFRPVTTGLVSKAGDTIEGDLDVQGRLSIDAQQEEALQIGDFDASSERFLKLAVAPGPERELNPEIVAILSSSYPKADDRFGAALAVHGNTAVVGAPNTDGGKGTAYVFEKTERGWHRVQLLLDEDKSPAYRFGESVAIHTETILVGASLFIKNSEGLWVYYGKLPLERKDSAVQTVSMNGDVAIGGAPADDKVYIFEKRDRNGAAAWEKVQEFLAPDGVNAFFGSALAIDGDLAVIGARYADNHQGAAYIYARDRQGQWAQQKKLVAWDGKENDNFGISVAIQRDTVIVGALQADDNRGAAYIFAMDGGEWQQQARLTASDRQVNGSFGRAVAIRGDLALVGAPDYKFGTAPESGLVHGYVSGPQGWVDATEAFQLHDPFPRNFAAFGSSLAIAGSLAFIGSSGGFFGGDDSTTWAGPVVIFSYDDRGYHATGLRLKHGDDAHGFTFQSEAHGLSILRHQDDPAGVPALSISRRTGLMDVFGGLRLGASGSTEISNFVPESTIIVQHNLNIPGPYVVLATNGDLEANDFKIVSTGVVDANSFRVFIDGGNGESARLNWAILSVREDSQANALQRSGI